MPLTSDRPPHDAAGEAPEETEALARSLPYLRRYARALTGAQEAGDDLVRLALNAVLADEALREVFAAGRKGLYRAFTLAAIGADPDGHRLDSHAPSQLGRVPPLRRQALLLNRMEDFSLADTATILGLTPEAADDLVRAALQDIARDRVADVLIIEDEPLISHHLGDLVASAGHRIVGSATTATQAHAAFARHRPTLVLSDIQLADGSSGIDAVKDILQIGPIPVIFITAFPERLLTGKKPEPTFLINKPFRDENVLATISQALFFGASLHG